MPRQLSQISGAILGSYDCSAPLEKNLIRGGAVCAMITICASNGLYRNGTISRAPVLPSAFQVLVWLVNSAVGIAKTCAPVGMAKFWAGRVTGLTLESSRSNFHPSGFVWETGP